MLPVASVVIAAAALWLASGVDPSQIGRYLGYELVFVIGPGWLLYRGDQPRSRSPLAQIAIGWPLGLVAEIALFSLTAALDARDLFYATPVLVGVPAALVWWRRSRASLPEKESERAGPSFGAAQRWAIAGVCLAVVAYFGLSIFARSPIPGSVPNVLYAEDLLFGIAMAAEAQQHWPLQTPQISGMTLHYHYFAHLHIAGIAQVTGIDTSIVVLRLFLVPLTALLLLQVALLARSVSGLAWAGPVAAALVALVGEVDLVTPQLAPFQGISTILLWSSPSYLLGLVMFVPLIALLAGLLEPRVRARIGGALGRRESWALVIVLALGASGAKVVALPLVGAGLFACLALVWLRARKLEPTALIGLALCLGIFAAAVLVLYATAGGGMRLGIGGSFEQMPALLLRARRALRLPCGRCGVLGDQAGSVHGAAGRRAPARPGLVFPAGRAGGQGRGIPAWHDGNRDACVPARRARLERHLLLRLLRGDRCDPARGHGALPGGGRLAQRTRGVAKARSARRGRVAARPLPGRLRELAAGAGRAPAAGLRARLWGACDRACDARHLVAAGTRRPAPGATRRSSS